MCARLRLHRKTRPPHPPLTPLCDPATMFPAWPFLVALVTAAFTLALPRRWLLFWLPLFWGGTILFWSSIDFDEDWAALGAAILFGPLGLLTGMASAIRIVLAIADLLRDSDRGY
jgi:hypothetical protein